MPRPQLISDTLTIAWTKRNRGDTCYLAFLPPLEFTMEITIKDIFEAMPARFNGDAAGCAKRRSQLPSAGDGGSFQS